MMRAGGKAALVAIALALAAAGCGRPPSEDVQVSVNGSQLVLENRSNTDIHFQLIQPLVAFIPLSTPLNRLEDGKTLKLRIAPSQRGETIDLTWWRPGERLDGTEIRGPDRVRRIRVKLGELTEPLPTDEAYIRACIALAAATAHEQRERPGGAARELARNYNAAKAERDCMTGAEQRCPDRPELCTGELATTQQALARVQEALERHRGAAAAANPAATTTSALDIVARQAFYDLRDGKVDQYLARLCEGTRKIYSGPFLRGTLAKTGQEFAQRGVDLVRVKEQGADQVTFEAITAAMQTGKAPALPPLRLKASFQREGDRDCLLEIVEIS